MEPFTFNSGKLKGVEVLYYDNVEIQKVKGNLTSFASLGSLSVLYFKTFDRFVLRINDWMYPLMRRIPITAETGAGTSTIFTLPAANGFSYRLIFSNNEGQDFKNFQTLLSHTSGFTLPGVERTLESSPDDKLIRHLKTTSTNTTSAITSMIKSSYEKVKKAAVNLGGNKKLLSTKRNSIKDIKNKNYRKSARSTFKKDFFDSELSLTKKFSEHRKSNLNLSEPRDFKALKKTNDSLVPSLFFNKEQIENAILNQKDLITQRNFTPSETTERRGIMDSIKGGLTGLKDQVTNIVHREARKETVFNQISGQQDLTEGLTHYSG